MICSRCKQLVVKVVFGVACACTVLTGQGDEPMHRYPFESPKIVRVAPVASTTTAPTGFIFDWSTGDGSS